MTPQEALEWAADYAVRNKIFDAPKNDRGYVRDGWKEPTPAERVAVIQDLAKSVMAPQPSSTALQVTGAIDSLRSLIRNTVKALELAQISRDPLSFDARQVQSIHDNLFDISQEWESA